MDNGLWVQALTMAISVGLGIALLRMLLALLGLVSSSGKLTRRSQHNKTLALAHIFGIAGYGLVTYAQLVYVGTKYQIPMDAAAVVCLLISWTSVIVIERRIRRSVP
ncbi:hypothetical protein [Kutzneria sp. CA-103260]|uniref:hypothetical protein n=1 Tax=Kutzneria sp. CA-103260 TaxID=2802641 RepID=UPI001BA8F146|nr:hypothetical protein [Kutzneria sp. CA-103260]QUQ72333.1 hypothetical protein JJ691_101210 [Kutzneria sp. CA-103260]